ncbi:MAG: LPS export ABC transporter periplasmic protein LptC [Cellvibrionaceae bacterium]|nr:LPS export ABC transporter periplasmic protein LptC [Cellvibrionaceae bacterium]
MQRGIKHNWAYISLTAALVVAVILLSETPPEMLIPFGEKQDAARFPYAVINDARSQHFDAEGKLSYEFVASTLSHFRLDLNRVSEGDFTSLEAPQLTLYTDDKPWYVTADKGELSERGTLLTLWPNVRIWQEENPDEVTELTTSRLEIRPQDKMIATEAEVNITSPMGKVEAQGMSVDLDNKRIQLRNRVRGHHEPINETATP